VTRNPDYWKKGRPYLDGIEYTITRNLSTAILAFVAAKFDMTFACSVTEPLLKDVKSRMLGAICELAPIGVNREGRPSTTPIENAAPANGRISGYSASRGPLPSRSLKMVRTVKLPDRFQRIDQKDIHYIHLIHQLVGIPSGKGTTSPAVAVSEGSVSYSARRSRIGAGRACRTTPPRGSHAHRSSLVRERCGGSGRYHPPSSASSDYRRARGGRRISRAARLARRERDELAPEVRGFALFPNSPSTNPSSSSRRMRAMWARLSLASWISMQTNRNGAFRS